VVTSGGGCPRVLPVVCFRDESTQPVHRRREGDQSLPVAPPRSLGRSTTWRVRSCTDGTGQAARARPARVRTHGPRRDDNGIGGTKREGRSVTRDWGPWLVGGGLLLLVGGLLAWTGALSWLGNLPGDIRISSGNTRIYIPITSMVLVSVALNVLLWLFLSLFHR